MTNFCGESDAAAEQLYDELMARTWALHGVVQSVVTDVWRTDVSARLAAAALSHVRALRERSVHADVLRALLWPVGSPPGVGDAWWATPLGQLMSAREPQTAPTEGNLIVDLVDDLAAS